MSAPIIAVINLSAKISNKDVISMVIACQEQLVSDVDPIWKFEKWFVIFYDDVKKVPARAYQIAIMDNPDTAGALGYHAEMNGKPYGRIFVDPVLQNGGVVLYDPKNPQNVSVSSVLSHEIIELRCDPFANWWAEGPRIAQGSEYALEACDPVQGDSYFKMIGGRAVSLSNFVTPAWFNPENSKDPVDFLGTCPGSFQLAPGGYMIVRYSIGREQEVFGAQKPAAWRQNTKKHPMARTSRRKSAKGAKKGFWARLLGF